MKIQFSNIGKRAAVCTLDKGETNHTVEGSFCPISVLNVFLIKNVFKGPLALYLDETFLLSSLPIKNNMIHNMFDRNG